MKIALVVLEYITVLVWPALIIGALFAFRVELRDLLRKLAELQLPGGTRAKFHNIPPEAQEIRRANELNELADGVETAEAPVGEGGDAQSTKQLEQRIRTAEDLVMKQLSAEWGEDLKRQVAYNSRPDLQFDGYVFIDDEFKMVEVKYVNAYRDLQKMVDFEFGKFDRMCAEGPDAKIVGLLVIVADVDLSTLQRLQVEVDAMRQRKHSRHEIRVYHLDSLWGDQGASGDR